MDFLRNKFFLNRFARCAYWILVVFIVSSMLSCERVRPDLPANSDSNSGSETPLITDSQDLSPGEYKLRSGNIVAITNVSVVNFPKSGPALVIYYKTSTPMENKVLLRSEVNEIWEAARVKADALKVNSCAIRAIHDTGTGSVTKGKGMGFVFLRDADGRWYCDNDLKDGSNGR